MRFERNTPPQVEVLGLVYAPHSTTPERANNAVFAFDGEAFVEENFVSEKGVGHGAQASRFIQRQQRMGSRCPFIG